jgi:16S rRNA (cytidine1402-2'-O)-methyltransferase
MSLYICPTPIGNLKDITIRVVEVLQNVDLILAEDTRITRNLLNKYEIKTPLKSFHSYTNQKRLEEIVSELRKGKNFALVSDAGTPGISDPGYNLIKACIDNKIHIEALPGPTSFVPALLLSGLPPDHFLFYGFLPRKKGKRQKILKNFEDFEGPIIYFESPYRVREFLSDVLESLGDRPVALVREISKMHEEVLRGNASEILNKIHDSTIKGEVVFVVGQKSK